MPSNNPINEQCQMQTNMTHRQKIENYTSDQCVTVKTDIWFKQASISKRIFKNANSGNPHTQIIPDSKKNKNEEAKNTR